MNHTIENQVTFKIHSTNGQQFEFVASVSSEAMSIADYLQKLMARAHGLEGGDDRLMGQITSQAEGLTQMIFSEQQREQISSFAEGTELVVNATLEYQRVPWELMRVNDQFWGLWFSLGRLISDLEIAVSPSTPIQNAYVFNSDALELISATTEQTSVSRRLRQVFEPVSNSLTNPATNVGSISRQEFLELLQSQDWFHFAGHAGESGQTRKLVLSKKSVTGQEQDNLVSATEIQQIQMTPGVVFLNACGSMAIPSREAEEKLPDCIVGSFLQRGTQWMIGPVVPVPDRQAQMFSSLFYDCLIEGHSIGESLRKARIEAVRKLGATNIIPLSYVLYGAPQYRFFTERPVMSVTSIQGKAELTYPLICEQCGGEIETRHGIGKRNSRTASPSVICRECTRGSQANIARDVKIHRGGRSDSWEGQRQSLQAEVDVENSNRAVASGNADRIASTEQNLVQQFQLHLKEIVARKVFYLDLITGLNAECVLVPKADVAQKSSARFAVLDQTRGKSLSQQCSEYLLQEPSSKTVHAEVVFIFWTPDSSRSKPNSLSWKEVENLVEDNFKSTADVYRYVFVCSTTGFDQESLQQMNEGQQPVLNDSYCSLFLHDIGNSQTFYSETDIAAYPLCHLLQRESLGKQFQKAITWLNEQLPLATSLSSHTVSTDLELEREAVEAGFRYIATHKQLTLDSTDHAGLVLSSKDWSTRETSQLQEKNPHQHPVPQFFLAMINWMRKLLRIT
ncbi:CHAT domain-containing protein [Gimesia sp.]|uniref:CHAT domain-containing protein n=1 Tax=Gimesia sp. TaxID=2024833 RepID=UPI003A8DA1AD